METEYLVEAIRFLKPTAEFSFINDDYSTVKWDVLDGDAPTKAEIEAAIVIVKNNKVSELAEKENARQAILSKLGLTAEEIAILLS